MLRAALCRGVIAPPPPNPELGILPIGEGGAFPPPLPPVPGLSSAGALWEWGNARTGTAVGPLLVETGSHQSRTRHEILQLECRLAAQAEENARLKKRQESGVGGVTVVGFEEFASALANAVRMLEKEARAIAQERAAFVDTRNQEALVLGRVDARLGQLQGVVTDSREAAQKKLTDEVARKIDNMSTAVSAIAEWAITTSGVTNALHTLIVLVGGAPPRRARIMKERPRRRLPRPGMQSMESGQRGNRDSDKYCGKGKAEDGEAPAAAGSLASRREVQSAAVAAAEGKQTTLAPARAAITAGNLHSALASASPIAASVEVKAEKRGWGGKKLPPPPVYTIDEDDADEELEGLVSRWVEAGDGGEQGGEAAVDVYSGGESADEQDGDPVIVEGGTTGGHGDTGPKRKGCGIRAPPRGGPGLVCEPHLGGKKRWLGHGDREDLQYKTAIAMYPYDGKVDPGLNLSQQQIREWAADLSIAEGLHTGLLIIMHYRNLVASKDSVTAAADNGNLAARAAGCYGERSRLFPVVSAYVINAVRKRNRREEDEPKVVADPKAVAAAIVSGVVNEVAAKSRDLRHIELAASETVDVIITWCDCSVARKQMESLGLYLALPKDCLKKRT
ncbi:unnamed protein product [Closterium sp. NIES-64]|nr:unnamed protein product [Closterium sp. NIES-64]